MNLIKKTVIFSFIISFAFSGFIFSAISVGAQNVPAESVNLNCAPDENNKVRQTV